MNTKKIDDAAYENRITVSEYSRWAIKKEIHKAEWIDCGTMLPEEEKEGIGTHSKEVEVMLSDGRMSSDWLINGKWVIHCKNNGGAYPVKWKEK